MNAITSYFKDIFHAIKTLLTGMRVTGYYFSHARKEIITQQYPENRDTLKMFDRFRGIVTLTHDENNEHACTGCSACEIACPNGTIEIISDREEDPETGKKKKIIDKFIYHYSMCTLCNLCIISCPTDAIKMDPSFEYATFDRKDLTMILNKPGSKIRKDVK
ncbi:MAG: 4Fe-4S binding protein [Cyclobacteriaceae bacterium]|nr:4Fe-4S binding protein [Cyclobacteriaceae bacterium]